MAAHAQPLDGDGLAKRVFQVALLGICAEIGICLLVLSL